MSRGAGRGNVTIDGAEGAIPVNIMSGLVPTAYDYIALTYTDTDLTKAEYYTGGSGGTKVATLTLAYTAHVLQTVTKT